MKNWLKKCCYILRDNQLEVMSTLVILSVIAGAFAFRTFLGDLAFWKIVTIIPEPEVCVVCGNGDGPRYHAPALVNVATGEMGEIQVYDPDIFREGEISATQRTGTFNFIRIAGITGYRDTSNHVNHVMLPEDWERFA